VAERPPQERERRVAERGTARGAANGKRIYTEAAHAKGSQADISHPADSRDNTLARQFLLNRARRTEL
jgi:hypothetical protein